MAADRTIADRVARVGWTEVTTALDADGWGRLGPLLTASECRALIRLYGDAARFRSHVDMARHRFGRGEYRYFAHPLAPVVAAVRSALYGQLAPLANRWMAALGRAYEYPGSLTDYLSRCHEAC